MIVAMAMVSMVLVLLCIAFGETDFRLSEVFQTVFDRESVPRGMASIIWNERIPQALAALFVGSALGVAGAEMQTVLDNPLAEPYTLGVSMSAAFGAALVMAFGIGASMLGTSAVVVSAFLFAMVTCAVISLDIAMLVSLLRPGDERRQMVVWKASTWTLMGLVGMLVLEVVKGLVTGSVDMINPFIHLTVTATLYFGFSLYFKRKLGG